jgi:hypothetical protein
MTRLEDACQLRLVFLVGQVAFSRVARTARDPKIPGGVIAASAQRDHMIQCQSPSRQASRSAEIASATVARNDRDSVDALYDRRSPPPSSRPVSLFSRPVRIRLTPLAAIGDLSGKATRVVLTLVCRHSRSIRTQPLGMLSPGLRPVVPIVRSRLSPKTFWLLAIDALPIVSLRRSVPLVRHLVIRAVMRWIRSPIPALPSTISVWVLGPPDASSFSGLGSLPFAILLPPSFTRTLPLFAMFCLVVCIPDALTRSAFILKAISPSAVTVELVGRLRGYAGRAVLAATLNHGRASQLGLCLARSVARATGPSHPHVTCVSGAP